MIMSYLQYLNIRLRKTVITVPALLSNELAKNVFDFLNGDIIYHHLVEKTHLPTQLKKLICRLFNIFLSLNYLLSKEMVICNFYESLMLSVIWFVWTFVETQCLKLFFLQILTLSFLLIEVVNLLLIKNSRES